MINMRPLLTRLDRNEITDFKNSLRSSHAEKLFRLLDVYLKEDIDDKDIPERLNISNNAFYTLKSRLYDKLQDFLLDNLEGARMHLLRKVSNIPYLLYRTDRNMSIAVLKKLEKELIEYDMPAELIQVYQALRKLHMHEQDKHYQYSQQYNQVLAQQMALEKAEEMLAEFNKKLLEWHKSRNEREIKLLELLKNELGKMAGMYRSHRLKMISLLAEASFSIYISDQLGADQNSPAALLDEAEQILREYPNDRNYQHLRLAVDHLQMELYSRYGMYRKAAEYGDAVAGRAADYVNYHFCAYPSRFLLSWAMILKNRNEEKEIGSWFTDLSEYTDPDVTNAPAFIDFHLLKAMGEFFDGEYPESAQTLNLILNEISFKNYPHAEIEIKCMLALIYILLTEFDLAHNLMRSITRKMNDSGPEKYPQVKPYLKLLKYAMKPVPEKHLNKIIEQKELFEFRNKGKYEILKFISPDYDLIGKLVNRKEDKIPA